MVACAPLPIATAPTPDAVPLNAKARSALAVPLLPNATDSSPEAVVARFAAKEFSPLARVLSPRATEPMQMFSRSQ